MQYEWSDTERAWLAGFFDGEGCITSRLRTPASTCPQVMIYLAQKNKALLESLQERLNMGTVRLMKNDNYQLAITGRDNIREFTKLIYDFSVVKRDQLRLGYMLAGLMGAPGINVGTERAERKLELHAALKEAKA